MAKSPEAMAQTMLDNLPEKTGKSMAQWSAVLNKAGLVAHGEIMKLLKGKHGVTHGFANLIAQTYRAGLSGGAPDDPLAAQYAGAKAALKPIYDAVVAAVQQFGDDVELAPKKAYVSIRRNKQFALVQPSTKTRVDLGINLKGVEPQGRLEASGSFNAMVSHRVRLEKKSDVNKQVKDWLKQAYDAA